MTTVASSASDAPRSVHDGSTEPVRSAPSTSARMLELVLNPSLRFHSPAAMWTPEALAGNASVAKATRRPVADAESPTVYASDG